MSLREILKPYKLHHKDLACFNDAVAVTYVEQQILSILPEKYHHYTKQDLEDMQFMQSRGSRVIPKPVQIEDGNSEEYKNGYNQAIKDMESALTGGKE